MADLASAQPTVVFGAVGIGVSDLARSVDFYLRACGMVEVRQYHLAYMEEVMLGYDVGGRARGPRLVLMHWTDGSPRESGPPVSRSHGSRNGTTSPVTSWGWSVTRTGTKSSSQRSRGSRGPIPSAADGGDG